MRARCSTDEFLDFPILFHKFVEKCMYNHLNNSVITLWKSTHTRLRLMKCGYPQGYYLVFRKFFTIFDRKKI